MNPIISQLEALKRGSVCHFDDWNAAIDKAIEVVHANNTPDLMLISAVHAMIGYCELLTAGTVITEGYVDRMKSHYIPQLENAMKSTPSGDNNWRTATTKETALGYWKHKQAAKADDNSLGDLPVLQSDIDQTREYNNSLGDASTRKDEEASHNRTGFTTSLATPAEAFKRDKAKYINEWSDPSLPITAEEGDAYKAGWFDGFSKSATTSAEDDIIPRFKKAVADLEKTCIRLGWIKPTIDLSRLDGEEMVKTIMTTLAYIDDPERGTLSIEYRPLSTYKEAAKTVIAAIKQILTA